jgi:hypothetical protein
MLQQNNLQHKTMKNIYILFFILSLLLSFSQAGMAQATKYKHETEIYSIEFPNQFEQSTQNLETAAGTLLMKISSLAFNENRKDSNLVYIIIDTDYPDSTVHSGKKEELNIFFNGATNGALSSSKGKLISQTEGTTGTYPHRILEIEFQEGLGMIRMKMILIKNKSIILQTITLKENYPNDSINRFFDSFKIK